LTLDQAAVVQLHGDTTRSWFLVSLASRSIVALSYHKMTSFDSDSDEENEIRRCIYYCYYMDKTLSMLLLRPPSLPQLPFNPADLVPTDPQLPISMHVKILVKLARVQDVALSLVLKDPRHQILANKEFMLENIQTELKSIGDEIQQVIKFPFTPLMEYTEIPLVAVSATPRTLNYDRMGYS
jgi:hypothetical protein